MATAKCLRRQAATCAALAEQTDDDESRQRYKRLELLYIQLANSEGDALGASVAFSADGTNNEAPSRQLNS